MMSKRMPEKTSPAITVNGDRGIAEGKGVMFLVRTGDGEGTAVRFSDWVTSGNGVVGCGVSPLAATMVIVLRRVFFMAGLLALTKY